MINSPNNKVTQIRLKKTENEEITADKRVLKKTFNAFSDKA